jgi:chemotaxis family two-component system sensor kinase Cph1
MLLQLRSKALHSGGAGQIAAMVVTLADQMRLFQAFQRASNVGSISGTGLAIVKQAAELHGGTVQLESQPDKGTGINVTIPACQVPR